MKVDCLADTNIVVRAADGWHAPSVLARNALKVLRPNFRICVAKQTLVETWVVATRPRAVNGFGYSPSLATQELAKIKDVFYVLAEGDEVFEEWEKLVVAYRVSGKAAYDSRLVAVMNVFGIKKILTFNVADFKRYDGIEVLHPEDVIAATVLTS